MAGFKREPKQYRLMFEDPSLEGLEVTMRSLTIEKFIELTVLIDSFGKVSDQAVPQTAADMEKLFQAFTKALVGWNLEDDEGPLLPVYEIVKSQELDFIMQIVLAWSGAMSAVAPPLSEGSSNGAISLEQSQQLASLSQSQAS